MKQPVVLIVDHNIEDKQMLSDYLREADSEYKILTANKAAEAVEKAVVELPDVIIMEWELLDMPAIDAIQRLKSERATATIPIIIASEKVVSQQNLEEMLKAGATDYIRKPLDKIELLFRVQSSLQISNSYRRIRKLYRELRDQYKNVTDSITYASRIQNFILPNLELLREVVSDAFIYYNPKDIVSGDFYWFNIKRKRIMVAAADCTGHGVPGAFMSILGTNALNQVARDYGTLDTNLLISELNERISAMLKQGYGLDSETLRNKVPPLDGMDVAFSRIDAKTNKVYFTGANRPIYYFHQGKLHSIKGDRHPIGGTSLLYDNVIYTQHEIQLEKGDTIYMCSDGLVDQFDSNDRKKYGNRRFKELLTDLQSEPMSKQEEVINQTLREWRGPTPQTDDLVLIGIKL